MSQNNFLIQVRDLKKYFYREGLFSSEKKPIRAVDGISFSIRKGETLGLVGESGCGKTTAGKAILRLIEPTSGEIFFQEQNILGLDRKAMRRLRPHMQFIFQDPYESLNPRMKVGEIIGEGLQIHGFASGKEKIQRVSELLEKVGLHPQDAFRYAHEFSGGQRQRIGIARAISLNPELIVADEPVSALDVSIQAQILNLLMDLRDQLGLTYLFISHDLRIVKHISDRIAVMYMGKIVEIAEGEDLFERPLHPYTQLLLKAIPKLDPSKKREEALLKEEHRLSAWDQGCLFQPRCPHSKGKCQIEEPLLLDEGKGHLVACHFAS
ncbi:MAG TPA: oligopeptide/dipeptide ABC transporter ATP-binding protein [Thermodesulfobacteriota bacterium]|jgi:oligopeptide/dipeptide ABC transporter ATP-binding protein|nr:oligopeptide/dipeptide ABC transporter ATP-binding protein [Thermodesulfobacteriota bacterium]